MRRFAPALLLLTAAAPPAPPTNQVDWRWSSDGPGCGLRQVFAADGTTLEIGSTPGSDGLTIRIGGYDWLVPTLETSFESLKDGRLSFVPVGRADAQIQVATDSSGRRDVSASSPDFTVLTQFAKASAVEISHERIGTIRAPLRSTAAAAEALRNCVDSRMREWGIDPVEWWALKARPVPLKPAVELLSADDYPARAQRYGLQGWVIAKLNVAADGKVTDCKSINKDLYRGFRDTICRVMRSRARFKPALDTNGNPVAAPYVLVVQFRLA